MRAVLLGGDPDGVTLTRRAQVVLGELRESYAEALDSAADVVVLPSGTAGRWWTWAGTAANRTLQASLPTLVDPRQRIDEKSLRLLPGLGPDDVSATLRAVDWQLPAVSSNALAGLKFSAALPPDLAVGTLAERLGDVDGARRALEDRRIIRRS